jgi:hypothetical protein
MESTLRLRVGQLEFLIDLLESEAPGLVAAVRRAAPHTTLAVHAHTAGAELCVPLPFFHWHENRRVPRPGDVGYASFNNYLCVYYGEMDADDGPTNVLGRVRGGLEVVRDIGAALLERSALPARLSIVGQAAAADAPLPDEPQPATPFTPVARAYLERSLGGMPDEIQHVRMLRRRAMGNMAARFHASSALMEAANILFACRQEALAGSVPQASINRVSAALARRSTRWLTMAGLADSAATVARLADWLESGGAGSAAEFAASVEELLVGLGRRRIWADAILPWPRLSRDYLPDAAWLAGST